MRILGVMLFVGAPLLPFFASAEFTRPDVLRVLAIALVIILPVAAAIAVLFVPEGRKVAVQKSTFKGLLRSMARNKPLWLLGVVFALSGVGIGLYNSVLLVFAGYLGISNKYSVLALVYFAVALFMLSGWQRLMNRIGKHRAWALGMGCFGFGLPLYWLVPPGARAFHYALGLTIFLAMASSAQFIAPVAVLGDIIDYDILKTGVNRAGNYYSLLQVAQKIEIALGGGLGFLLLGWFGFNFKGANGSHAILGLKLTFLGFPAVLYIACAFLIWRLPIDARRHGIIRRRIESLASRRAHAGQ
jgi:Na+/melibiose symporter-like transporter